MAGIHPSMTTAIRRGDETMPGILPDTRSWQGIGAVKTQKERRNRQVTPSAFIVNEPYYFTNSNRSTSNSPDAGIFNAGMTGSDMNERVMNGDGRVHPFCRILSDTAE